MAWLERMAALACGLAATGWGCSSSVVDDAHGGGGSGGTGPGGITCPAEEPSEGGPCPVVGQACEYEIPPDCEPTVTVVCGKDGWHHQPVCCGDCCPDTCPPQPDCPAEMPEAGTPCTTSSPLACTYSLTNACGQVETRNAVCSGGTWQVDESFCSTTQACAQRGDASSCAGDGACRWLAPGCGEPPLDHEGCFPRGDCAAEPAVCASWEVCVTVVVDPCWMAGCAACAADAHVCRPLEQ